MAVAHRLDMRVSIVGGKSWMHMNTPTIVVREPQSRWGQVAGGLIRLAGMAILMGGAFWAGSYYEQTQARLSRPGLKPAQSRPDGSEPAVISDATVRIPEDGNAQELLKKIALEGLEIQQLEIVQEATAPRFLKYLFEVGNSGRQYAGEWELTVLGTVNGKQTSWVYPPENQKGSPAVQMRVLRYLKSEGRLEMPPGMQPRLAALRLREPSGVRASLGTQVGVPPSMNTATGR